MGKVLLQLIGAFFGNIQKDTESKGSKKALGVFVAGRNSCLGCVSGGRALYGCRGNCKFSGGADGCGHLADPGKMFPGAGDIVPDSWNSSNGTGCGNV